MPTFRYSRVYSCVQLCTKVIKDQGPNREKFSFEKNGHTDSRHIVSKTSKILSPGAPVRAKKLGVKGLTPVLQ